MSALSAPETTHNEPCLRDVKVLFKIDLQGVIVGVSQPTIRDQIFIKCYAAIALLSAPYNKRRATTTKKVVDMYRK